MEKTILCIELVGEKKMKANKCYFCGIPSFGKFCQTCGRIIGKDDGSEEELSEHDILQEIYEETDEPLYGAY